MLNKYRFFSGSVVHEIKTQSVARVAAQLFEMSVKIILFLISIPQNTV